jgi:hypothetical protein
VELTIDSHKELATMPQDFVGLSYESAQLPIPHSLLLAACRQCARGDCLCGAHGDAMLVALVNKSGSPVQVKLRGSAARASECWTLTASSIDAKDGVEFAQASRDERLVPAYSAVLRKLPLMRPRND